MYLLLGYIRAHWPPGFPLLHACRALAYTYVITRIQHCNPVSAGTDGTILCLSYLASLPSCVTIEECQMSGFNTEKLLARSCISIHLTNLFSVLFQHTSCSQLRYMTFCLLLELGCKDSVSVRGGGAKEQGAAICAGTYSWTNCSSLLLSRLPTSFSQVEPPLPQGAVVNHIFLLLCHIFVSS